jgi:GT2 family glycosyltransferase
MTNPPELSVVLGSYNRKAFLKASIKSIRQNGIDVPYEIIVVDGGSSDGSLAWLVKQKDIITIVQHNHGSFAGRPVPRRSWGYFMNLAFKSAQGKFILMVSDDTLLTPGSVTNGLDTFHEAERQGRKIGGVAFYWRNWPFAQDFMIGKTLGDKILLNHGLYLKQAIAEVGFIDENNFQFYHADSDLTLKLWSVGYEIIDCPKAFVEHFPMANIETRQSNMAGEKEDLKVLYQRWESKFVDPKHPIYFSSIHLPYQDPTNTARKFPWFATIPPVLYEKTRRWLKKSYVRVFRKGIS